MTRRSTHLDGIRWRWMWGWSRVEKRRPPLVAAVLVLYLAVLLVGTLGPAPSAQVQAFGNSVDGIRSSAGFGHSGSDNRREQSARQDPAGIGLAAEDIANILVFVPLPLLVAAQRCGRWWIGLPVGVALTFVIEGAQLWALDHRSAQWEDVRWNILGVVVGFLLLATWRVTSFHARSG